MANQRTRTPSFASDRFAARQASPRPLSASSGGVGRTSELLIRQSGRARSASLRPLASLLIRLRESDFLTSLLVRSFRALQRLGVNVTPNHFYWPIPDVAGLEHRDWQPARMTTDLHLEKQLFLLEKITAEYGSEWSFPESAENHCGEYHYNNGLFETVDAEIAYSLVRQYKPPRIIEIGSGFSTRLLARALEANRGEGSGGELITIDPSPGKRLPAPRWLNQVTVIPQPVEDLDLELFRNLAPNDVLFIDSSHVVKTGSDVVREYLEILPALPPGVLVHVHDIFLPWDYPRDMVVKNLSSGRNSICCKPS